MSVRLYRLLDGNQVVGEDVLGEDDNLYNVLQVTLSQDDNGLRIGLAPLLYPFQRQHTGTIISKKNTLMSDECPQELYELYDRIMSEQHQLILPSLESAE
jgi:hypothetical protein